MFRGKTQRNHLCPAIHLSAHTFTILFSLCCPQQFPVSLSDLSASPLHPPHPQEMSFIQVVLFLLLIRHIIFFLGPLEVPVAVKMHFC